MAGESNWTHIKDVLGRTIDTEAGIVALIERKIQELWTLVDITAMQRHMERKELERLVGKLCSMHLAVPGAVLHLYRIQRALYQGGWTGPGCCRNLIKRSRTGVP